jgi:thiosulfate/3-mercaptopyruvate sulfurtransferase
MIRQVLYLVAMLTPAADADKTYPRAELLMEPAELAKPEVAKKYRILDARPRGEYLDGHVPGAVWIDHKEWAKAFAADQDAKKWAARIGKLGIGDETPVVVYASALNDAARIWWILHYWDVKDARLLNGGWKAWRQDSLPVSQKGTEVAAASFSARAPQKRLLATKDQLLKELKQDPPQLVDARSYGEYCGTSVQAKRGGAIPGAVNQVWSQLLDARTGRFRSAEQLRLIFKQDGIKLDRPTVTYCQSGGRAAVVAFALELMGAKDVRNYYRSWAEWGNAEDTPVVQPKR